MINKDDILSAWNEAEELHCSLSTLSSAEIEECHDSLVARAVKIMELLNEVRK